MKTYILKASMIHFLTGMGVYLAAGYLFHLILFPESKPAIATYFKPGEQFYSKTEGFLQTESGEAGKWNGTLYVGDRSVRQWPAKAHSHHI